MTAGGKENVGGSRALQEEFVELTVGLGQGEL